jgi:O-antigen/teichoic acid export membrane protein
MILIFVNTAGVGLYNVASSQTEGLLIISNSVAVVLLTSITSDRDSASQMTPVTCRNTLLITGVSAVVAALIAGLWIPEVFGAKYQDSVEPYIWLLPGIVALSGAKILAAYVFSRGRPMINTAISLVTLIASLPVQVVLLGLWGVPGAAAATSINYAMALALTALAYRRLSGNPILEALLPRPSDVSIYTDMLRSIPRRFRRSSGVVEASTSRAGEA